MIKLLIYLQNLVLVLVLFSTPAMTMITSTLYTKAPCAQHLLANSGNNVFEAYSRLLEEIVDVGALNEMVQSREFFTVPHLHQSQSTLINDGLAKVEKYLEQNTERYPEIETELERLLRVRIAEFIENSGEHVEQRSKQEVLLLGKRLIELNGYPAHHMGFSQDGRLLAVHFEDGTIRVEDAKTGAAMGSFKVSKGYAGPIDFFANGKYIKLHTSGKQGYEIWDYRKPILLQRFDRTRNEDRLRLSTGSIFASLIKGTVTLWSSPNGKIKTVINGTDSAYVGKKGIINIALSSDGSRLLTASNNNEVTLWDSSGRRIATFLEGMSKSGYTSSQKLVFSPDASHFAFAWLDTLAVGGSKTGSRIAFSQVNHAVTDKLILSNEGKYIATDRIAAVWKVEDLDKPYLELGKAKPLGFSPDNRWFVNTVEKGNKNWFLQVWDLQSKKVVSELPIRNDYYSDTVFTKDRFVYRSNLMITAWEVSSKKFRVWKPNVKLDSSGYLSPNGGFATVHTHDQAFLWNLDLLSEEGGE